MNVFDEPDFDSKINDANPQHIKNYDEIKSSFDIYSQSSKMTTQKYYNKNLLNTSSNSVNLPQSTKLDLSKLDQSTECINNMSTQQCDFEEFRNSDSHCQIYLEDECNDFEEYGDKTSFQVFNLNEIRQIMLINSDLKLIYSRKIIDNSIFKYQPKKIILIKNDDTNDFDDLMNYLNNQSDLMITNDFNYEHFKNKSMGISFVDEEFCWEAWQKISTSLGIDAHDNAYQEEFEESKIVQIRGLDIQDIRNDKFDSIQTFEQECYKLITMQTECDDIDELVHNLLETRDTINELYETFSILKDKQCKLVDKIIEDKEKINKNKHSQTSVSSQPKSFMVNMIDIFDASKRISFKSAISDYTFNEEEAQNNNENETLLSEYKAHLAIISKICRQIYFMRTKTKGNQQIYSIIQKLESKQFEMVVSFFDDEEIEQDFLNQCNENINRNIGIYNNHDYEVNSELMRTFVVKIILEHLKQYYESYYSSIFKSGNVGRDSIELAYISKIESDLLNITCEIQELLLKNDKMFKIKYNKFAYTIEICGNLIKELKNKQVIDQIRKTQYLKSIITFQELDFYIQSQLVIYDKIICSTNNSDASLFKKIPNYLNIKNAFVLSLEKITDIILDISYINIDSFVEDFRLSDLEKQTANTSKIYIPNNHRNIITSMYSDLNNNNNSSLVNELYTGLDSFRDRQFDDIICQQFGRDIQLDLIQSKFKLKSITETHFIVQLLKLVMMSNSYRDSIQFKNIVVRLLMNDQKTASTIYLTNIMFSGYSAELNIINLLVQYQKITTKISTDPRFEKMYTIDNEFLRNIKNEMKIDDCIIGILNCSMETEESKNNLDITNPFNNNNEEKIQSNRQSNIQENQLKMASQDINYKGNQTNTTQFNQNNSMNLDLNSNSQGLNMKEIQNYDFQTQIEYQAIQQKGMLIASCFQHLLKNNQGEKSEKYNLDISWLFNPLNEFSYILGDSIYNENFQSINKTKINQVEQIFGLAFMSRQMDQVNSALKIYIGILEYQNTDFNQSCFIFNIIMYISKIFDENQDSLTINQIQSVLCNLSELKFDESTKISLKLECDKQIPIIKNKLILSKIKEIKTLIINKVTNDEVQELRKSISNQKNSL